MVVFLLGGVFRGSKNPAQLQLRTYWIYWQKAHHIQATHQAPLPLDTPPMPVAFPAQASPSAVPVPAVSVPVSAVSAPVSAPVSAGSALRPFGSSAAGGKLLHGVGRVVEVCLLISYYCNISLR